jgi:hypothetical protein
MPKVPLYGMGYNWLTTGAYGIENRNKKGTSLINLMASLNMKITNSFFNPRPSNLNATTMRTT